MVSEVWEIPRRRSWGAKGQAVLEHFVRPPEQWDVVKGIYTDQLAYVRKNVEGWRDNAGPYQLMTADKFRGMLARNIGNRSFQSVLAAKYCDRICSAAWEFTGEPILLSAEGNLMSGQHRGTGFVWAQDAFDAVYAELQVTGRKVTRLVLELPMIVIRGLDPKVMPIIDTGRVRTAVDAMDILREERARLLAPTLRRLVTYLRSHNLASIVISGNIDELDNGIIRTTLKDYPEIRGSVDFIARTVARGQGPISTYALVHFLLARKHGRTAVDEFFDNVFRGTEIVAGSPAARMHDILQAHASRKHTYEDSSLVALLIRAWNAFSRGESGSHVTYRPTADNFPEV